MRFREKSPKNYRHLEISLNERNYHTIRRINFFSTCTVWNLKCLHKYSCRFVKNTNTINSGRSVSLSLSFSNFWKSTSCTAKSSPKIEPRLIQHWTGKLKKGRSSKVRPIPSVIVDDDGTSKNRILDFGGILACRKSFRLDHVSPQQSWGIIPTTSDPWFVLLRNRRCHSGTILWSFDHCYITRNPTIRPFTVSRG